MNQALRKRREQQEGFTLIELLIVIIILGILAAIVVFAVGNTRKDSVSSSCKTDFKSVELSSEAVLTKTGSPAPLPGVATQIDESTAAASNSLVSGSAAAVFNGQPNG